MRWRGRRANRGSASGRQVWPIISGHDRFRRPRQDRSDPVEEMVHYDRFREHVVSADVSASVMRGPVTFGRDHDDRNVLTAVRSASNMFDEGYSIHARHSQIDEDHLVIVGGEVDQCRASIEVGGHRRSGHLKHIGKHLKIKCFVIDAEKLHRSCRSFEA
jgi:hypothetical protein